MTSFLQRFCTLSVLLIALIENLQAQQLSVYAYLSPGYLGPVLAAFEYETGIQVDVEYMTAADLLNRLQTESNQASADVIFTMEAKRLAAAAAADVLTPVRSDVLEAAIPAHFRHPDGLWFGLSKWSRSVYYAKARVDPSQLRGYASLAEPRWKGRICVRTGNKVYVQSLLASIIAHEGEQNTTRLVTGLVENFARTPVDLDVEQIRAVGAGLCDLAIANSYYYARLATLQYNPLSVAAGAQAKEVLTNVLPLALEQSGRGTHMNISGFALTKATRERVAAIRLMEYMVQPLAQRLYADTSKDFPIVDALRSDEARKMFGEFREDTLPVADWAEHYPLAEQITRQAGWLWK